MISIMLRDRLLNRKVLIPTEDESDGDGGEGARE